MPISAGLREDIAVYRGFIGQQYKEIWLCGQWIILNQHPQWH